MTVRSVPPEPAIHRAARLGDHAAIERLLAAGTDVDARADLEFDHGPHLRGLTPLLTAARSIDGATVETLRLLLDRRADLHARAEGGGDAAWYAAGTGMRIPGLHPWRVVPDHVDRLRFLLDAGLSAQGMNGAGVTCVCEAGGAGDPARVDLLLARGATPGPVWGADGVTTHERSNGAILGARRAIVTARRAPPSWVIPLFRAAESGSRACVERLLAAGASVAQRDDGGRTVLAYARSPDVVGVLVRAGADVRSVDRFGNDAVAAVLEETSADGEGRAPHLFEVARALVASGAPRDRVPGSKTSRLYDAAFRHQADAVEFLLALGARPEADSYEHRTPLHAIAWRGEPSHPPMQAACERIIRALVAAGNSPNAEDDTGQTPLADAREGDWPCDTAVRVLLELGADPDGERR